MSLTTPDLPELLVRLNGTPGGFVDVDQEVPLLYHPRYNVAPGQLHPVLRGQPEGPCARLVFAHWGMLARGPSRPPSINARAETASVQPAFRAAFSTRRCVIPADGFFEWQNQPEGRRPLWFHRRDGNLLLMAGLYDDPRPDGDAPVRFVILTTAPNQLVAPVHDRMPAILSPEEAAAWLREPTQDFLHAAPEDLLVATPVSLRVNSVKNDDPACLAPPPAPAQLDLFDRGIRRAIEAARRG